MPTSQLFRMDDFLIKAAIYLGVAVAMALMVLASWISADPTSVGSVISPRLAFGFIGFALAPIGMGIAGFQVRRREKRALALWQLIDREVEISASDLLQQSDWTAASLDRAVRDLNNAGAVYVVWDRQAGLIQDGRLRRSSLVVDECSSCSGKLAIQVAIGEAGAIRCPYCDDPIDTSLIAEEKARLIDELEADRSEGAAANGPARQKTNFSFVIFALLFAVFWPAGLWYCWKHRGTIADLIA